MDKAKNILGTELKLCCNEPKTGYFRDGYCSTAAQDYGTHVVCALITDEFLQFTKSRGNDLITVRPEYDFPGLKAGDYWCLCALRWKEAHDAGCAPKINPEATNAKMLEFIDINILEGYFIK